MYNELISIVVTFFNEEEYITRCVSSIIEQTYQNLEILLIDDGSTDKSGEICKELAKNDTRIKYYYKKNGGLSDARNFGILRSNGLYISFVDSDDWIANNFIETLYNSIKCYNTDLAICRPCITFDNYSLVMKTSNKINILNNDTDIRNIIFDDKFGPTAWGKLYKKTLFDNITFPTGRLYEDSWIMHKILNQCKKITTIDTQLYFYVQRKNSIMHSMNENSVIDLCDLYKSMLNCQILHDETIKIVRFFLIRAKILKCRSLFKTINGKNLKYLRKIINNSISYTINRYSLDLKTYFKCFSVIFIYWFSWPKVSFTDRQSKFYINLKKLQNKIL